MPSRAADDPVARVASELLATLELLADELVAQIAGQIDLYGTGSIVSLADLRRSVVHNLRFMLGQLAQVGAPDLTAPRQTGRERAAQGAPLPEILRAYRFGFAFLWAQLLAAARRSGQDSLDALLNTATEIRPCPTTTHSR